MSYKSDSKYFNERTSLRIKCSCGHSIIIPKFRKKTLCDWCGKYVYRDKKNEFEDKVKCAILKDKMEDRIKARRHARDNNL